MLVRDIRRTRPQIFKSLPYFAVFIAPRGVIDVTSSDRGTATGLTSTIASTWTMYNVAPFSLASREANSSAAPLHSEKSVAISIRLQFIGHGFAGRETQQPTHLQCQCQ